MPNFNLLSETIAYENPYFSILDQHYRLPNGDEHHFFIRKEIDTCCVLAMTTEGDFIFEKEFRIGPGKSILQLPAGRLEDEQDDPDERIKAELLEETGYTGDFKKLAAMPTSPYSTRFIHCYYASNCKKIAEQKLDNAEFIEVQLLSPSETRKTLLTGQTSSAAPGMLAWEWMKEDGLIEL